MADNSTMVLAIATPIGTVMAGCIAYLFKQWQKQNDNTIAIYKEQGTMREKLGRVEGRQDGIEDLANRALDRISEEVRRRPEESGSD